jgi:hypothetical protein
MKKEKEVMEQGTYLPDEDLYILWLLIESKSFLNPEKITFGNLTALGSNEMRTVLTLKNFSRSFGFEVKGFELVRGKYAFDGFCASEYEKNQSFCKRMPDSPVAKALVKIHSGNFCFEDVARAGLRAREYLEFIEFSPEIIEKSKNLITDFVSQYLTDYTKDKLTPDRNNFYEFKKQMVITYGILKKYIDQFGDSFVFELAQLSIKQEELPKQKESPYLPIHNLLAFDAMNFIKIDQIWISDWETPPEEERGTYKVRVKIKQSLLDFFGAFDPKITYDFGIKTEDVRILKSDKIGDKLEFDDRTSTLFFADAEILISKQAENDPHELLRTIFKDRSKVWNTDEVLEDWKFCMEKDRIPKNKVYQAGKAVNRIVSQDTIIKDFLDVSTKSVSIKKKYLKS